MNKHFDIVVLGSGLVGSSFVLALAKAQHKNKCLNIAIIDKQPWNSDAIANTEQDNARAIALSHHSVESLKNLEVWQDLQSESTPIHEVLVSSEGHFGVTRLQAKQQQLQSLGAVVDADRLNHALNAKLNQLCQVIQFRPDEILTCESRIIEKENQSWELTLASGHVITTSLLIGADGTESFVRKRFGIEAITEDYQQHAIVCNLFLNNDHGNLAYERFLNQKPYEGSLALLPFGKQRMKCIFITHQEQAKVLVANSEQDYIALLQQAFGFRLGSFKAIGKRFSYPLRQVAAESIYGPGWVLLGNAANTLHPVAAQGFNLGLRDAMTLANELATTNELSLASKQDEKIFNLGSSEILSRYCAKRKADHFHTRLFTETLVKRKASLPFGILCSEFLPFVKDRIMSQGLGIRNPT